MSDLCNKILKDNPSVNIQIEGHCDERGGSQYNLALGEKRANAVKSQVTAGGIGASRVTIISMGKEHPIAQGNRPAVEQTSAKVADYFHQRGLSGAGLQQETSTVLGGFATLESVAHGFRSGLRFLSLMMLTIGLAVAVLLARAARGLRAPPGSGYT